jgi:hypothetical protein
LLSARPSTYTKDAKKHKRSGPPTHEERAVIARVVDQTAGQVPPEQVKALAIALDRNVEGIKAMILTARDRFLAGAHRAVEIHQATMEQAIVNGDAKSLDVARQASQWAIEHMTDKGTAIVEGKQEDSSGIKVLIGVKIGGLNEG